MEVDGNPFDFLLQAIEDTNRGDAVLELPRRPRIEPRLQGGAAPRARRTEAISSAHNKKNKMSPYDTVRSHFNFPFELRPYQVREVNRLSQGDRHIFTFEGDGDQGDGEHAGHYDEPGTGKTAISTHQALYQMVVNGIGQWIVLMPPILIPQWGRWLRSITSKETGLAPTVTEYRGNPKQRAKLSLDSNFLLMSYAMFKNDIEKLWTHLDGRRVGGIADEGHALKNHESANHKMFFTFFEGRHRQILTGTPLTKPGDAFGYCRLVAPGRYRNHRHFEKLHAAEYDDYDKVIAWQNLDVLAESMRINSSRILRREVVSEVPKVQFTPIVYDLDPAHLKLYQRLSTEKLLEFEDGREINALNESALYSALQQIVLNWGYFEDDATRIPAALDLIDSVFEEIGDTAKLVVVAHFQRSNAMLVKALQKYRAGVVYGGVTSKQKQDAITNFVEDPESRCIILQPSSAGFGVDGLQHVCSDMLILEAPTTAPPFHQTVARLDRDGQKLPVNCRIAIANKTVQVKMFKNLLSNDAQINSVQRGFQDLKDAVAGAER